DLTLPVLEPCSRLYRLEPIGIGSPMVESLTGYVARLAEAHRVTPWTLYRHEIAPLMNRPRIRSMTLSESARFLKGINGAWALAVDFTTVMESLTKRQGLRHLTLLNWAALRKSGMLRPMRAWCSDCLRVWSSTGKPIYEPLLWVL